ncbi:MAG: helix-turn-helix domain-containing protein [Rhodobacteraceae bacterium]|nr:helix-turn-helix domain-containing protein [Paracoccaceae bacterium]
MSSTINSVVRFLDVLMALNQHNGASVSELAKLTGLPRGTSHRIVETLRAQGYVRRDVDAGSVWLTKKVRSLSAGYENQNWLDALAKPVVDELARKVGWDVALTMPEGGVLLNRLSTQTEGPMAITSVTRDFPLALLDTASGRTYLAFAQPNVRETLIRACLRETPARLRGTPDQVRQFRADVETIRARGYALHEHEKFGTAIAVPFYAGVAVHGCLSMHFPAKALGRAEIEESYLPQMWAAAEKLGALVETKPGP